MRLSLIIVHSGLFMGISSLLFAGVCSLKCSYQVSTCYLLGHDFRNIFKLVFRFWSKSTRNPMYSVSGSHNIIKQTSWLLLQPTMSVMDQTFWQIMSDKYQLWLYQPLSNLFILIMVGVDPESIPGILGIQQETTLDVLLGHHKYQQLLLLQQQQQLHGC